MEFTKLCILFVDYKKELPVSAEYYIGPIAEFLVIKKIDSLFYTVINKLIKELKYMMINIG